MRRAVLIYNPRSGRWRAAGRVDAIGRRLLDGGYAVEPLATAGPTDATRLAREAAAGGAETVFAYGGDGTLREAAAGVLGSRTAVAPLPGGTANVVARALGLPADPLRAADRLCGSTVRAVDVGRAGGEIFLMQLSAGLDARVLRRVPAAGKRLLGRGAFAWAACRQWWLYAYPDIVLRAAGRSLGGSFVAVCNLPHYGGALRMAPAARIDDRRLDLILFRGRGRAATLGFARDLLLGRHVRRPDVTVLPAEAVEILAPDGLEIQIDGDAVDLRPPITVDLAPERLRLLAPWPADRAGKNEGPEGPSRR